MVGKVNFLLGIHNHQPVGNFEHVLEDAYQRAYKPFFEVFEKFDLKLTVHFTGWLLEWLKERHPEYLDRLKALVEAGRLEIATGGFYEPIIPVIPPKDRIDQIKLLTKFVEDNFNCTPRGMWLAERIWEPQIAKELAQAGVEYVVVDDNHFHWAGLHDDELVGYYVTEEEGHTLKIFPISKTLRYLIPFEPPERALEHLKQFVDSSGYKMQVMFDDGEKFGLWPGTYEHVYKKGWLKEFFSVLEATEWIEVKTFSEYIDSHPPAGRVYIPISSYVEMTEWALPSRAREKFEDLLEDLKNRGEMEKYGMFLKGGIWRSFLAKYTEANLMHKKMLYVGKKIEESENEQKKKEARKYYFMGQANDAYWHGVFGGLYLPHLREAIFSNLIKAETLLDGESSKVINLDIDCDGSDEIVVETPYYNFYLDPDYGGRIIELDYRTRYVNILNNLTRRYEPYHRKLREAVTAEELTRSGTTKTIHDVILAREEGLEKLLAYDWYERYAMIDHFLGWDTTLDKFERCEYSEQGDFVNQPYRVLKCSEKEIVLKRDGHVWVDSNWVPISLEKRLSLKDRGFRVTYIIGNGWTYPVELWFSVENNVSLLAPNASDRYYTADGRKMGTMSSRGAVKARVFGVTDEYRKVSFKVVTTSPVEHWYFPVYTVSYSEAGFEKVYQCSSISTHFRIALEPGELETLEFFVRLDEI